MLRSDPAFVVIGHPAHRRVTMFQAALAQQRLPPARVIAWAGVAEPGAPARLLAGLGRAILRIDSAGEDDAIDRAFLGLFDKRATSARWHALGIPVPDTLPGGDVRDPDDLRRAPPGAPVRAVFRRNLA